ncbi:hypothetical protein PFMC_01161 [Plasmodium falciparum CAMP/Malaysia]|uniref:Uncharacterized protein n=1 Tax=Plasmodium falciparum (isolate Camp / Malaysia) TaxID=5835 RepID=A0A024XCH1_PLAFC|nr:hypothetical protein PFMC_01161 [Plasmodium falciparum CAMP/Malaysia]
MIKIRNISLNRISSIASIICLLDCPKCNELLEKYHVFISILSIILLLSNNYTSQKMIKKRNLDHCCSIKRFGKNANNSSFTNHHSSEHACNEDHHDHHDHHNRTISASSNNGNKYYMNYDKNERELVSFL